MNNVSTKDWIEWLIMGFSFLFSLYVYVNHTRRLNRQQKTINDQQSQINDYIIKENEEQERNKKKAKLIYDYLDQSTFYKAHSDRENRSLMNVTFTTPNKDLDAKFVKESIEAGMTNLKGHRSVGGIRASIYNAMPYEGVEKLVAFMKEFEENNR